MATAISSLGQGLGKVLGGLLTVGAMIGSLMMIGLQLGINGGDHDRDIHAGRKRTGAQLHPTMVNCVLLIMASRMILQTRR